MTVLELVRAELVASAAVTALVATRIYPNKAEQGCARPYLVMTVPSDVPLNTVDGAAATRLHNARVQVDAYAVTYLVARQVAAAVVAVVADLARHDLAGYLNAKRDLYDDEAQLHRVSMDFLVDSPAE